MPTTVEIILMAAIAVFTGYFINQLPEVRQFKGRNRLIVQLLMWITLLVVVHQLLSHEQVVPRIKTIAKYSIAPLGLLLLLDLWKLRKGILRQTDADGLAPQDLRTRLLKAVQGDVAERLEDSLHQQVVINLLMQQQLSQVNRPDKEKRISLKEITQKQAESKQLLVPNRSLNHGTISTKLDPQESIFDTFNRKDVGRKLLILGAPGAGKTTTLLKLAEQLLEEALQDGQDLIPVIFELSTWKDDKQTIQDWLVEQLRLSYPNIDRKTGIKWLKNAKLLPLLDGLDELGLQRQKTCVRKINEFVKGLTYPHLVVCCRSEEYAEGKVRLSSLKGAVRLEPLNISQIRQFLCRQLERPEIWKTIQEQPGLKALLYPSVEYPSIGKDAGILRIPLFLTILAAAYSPVKLIKTKEDLLDVYISKRLASETREMERQQITREWAYHDHAQEPDTKETEKYLIWLAQILQRENIVDFLIERMQPRWIETWQKKLLFQVVVSLLVTLGLPWIASGVFSIDRITSDLFIFEVIAVFTIMAIAHHPNGYLRPVEKLNLSISQKMRQELGEAITKSMKLISIYSCFILALLFGLISFFLEKNIESLMVGFFMGFILFPISCLLSGFLLGFVAGVSEDFEIRNDPNQGMWVAVINIPLTILLSFSITLGVLYLMSLIQIEVLLPGSLSALLDVLLQRNFILSGIFVGLWFGMFVGGGTELIRHLTLRVMLTYSGKIPWNYARFLNYCHERRVLHRIGGRYRFIHRELLDHFAEM